MGRRSITHIAPRHTGAVEREIGHDTRAGATLSGLGLLIPTAVRLARTATELQFILSLRKVFNAFTHNGRDLDHAVEVQLVGRVGRLVIVGTDTGEELYPGQI